MQYQRTVSFVQDLQGLADEERALANTALRTFMKACDVAQGAAPVLPSWIVVRNSGDSRKIWEMTWHAGGLAGRATFDTRRADDKGVCIRWRRLMRGTSDAFVQSGPGMQPAPAAPKEIELPASVARGKELLPNAAGLVLFTRTPRNEIVYLEAERWEDHVVAHHVTQPPTVRGKSTTTWWPVLHTATGYQSMNLEQVLELIADTVRFGHWQNAPRGTRLAVYQVPDPQAQVLGVAEVKVSAAPDGRILSAYPSAGSNVLAVRERTAEELAADEVIRNANKPAFSPLAAAEQQQDEYRPRVAQTTFG